MWTQTCPDVLHLCLVVSNQCLCHISYFTCFWRSFEPKDLENRLCTDYQHDLNNWPSESASSGWRNLLCGLIALHKIFVLLRCKVPYKTVGYKAGCSCDDQTRANKKPDPARSWAASSLAHLTCRLAFRSVRNISSEWVSPVFISQNLHQLQGCSAPSQFIHCAFLSYIRCGLKSEFYKFFGCQTCTRFQKLFFPS